MDKFPAFSDDYTETGVCNIVAPTKTTVNGVEVEHNPRALHGDIVGIKDGVIVNVIERTLHRLPGVLELNRKNIIGKNKKGIDIFKFRSIDWRYPDFEVASKKASTILRKSHDTVTNIYAYVEFREWDTKNRAPQGNCLEIIGNFGDIAAEERVLIYKNQLNIKKHKVIPKPQLITDDTDYRGKHIITIDPTGSSDFDDALHIENDKVCVHIADVDHYFPTDGPAENEIISKMTTIYGITRQFPMIPDDYAHHICSLKAGESKKVITAEFYTDGTNRVIFKPSTIIVKKNMTYDEANSILKGEKESPIQSQLQRLSDYTHKTDTHEIVSTLMIKFNHEAGKKIAKSGHALIRVHHKTKGIHTPSEINQQLTDHLVIRRSTAAEYVLYDAPYDDKFTMHEQLALEFYTHASSPIRRYPDILVHRILKTGLCNHEYIESILHNINAYYKKVRKFQRELDVLRLYNDLNTKHHGSTITTGYIVDINIERGLIWVYLDKFQLEYRTRLYPRNLEHMVTASVEDNIINIDYRGYDSSKSYELTLYKPYSVSVTSNRRAIKFSEKINMKIESLLEG